MPPWLAPPEALAEPLAPLGAPGVPLGNAAALGATGVRDIGEPLPSAELSRVDTVCERAPSAVLMAVTGDAFPVRADGGATPGTESDEPGG